MQKKVLITGASGFVGSTLVDLSLERGYETWAGIRKTSSLEFLQDKRINFVDFDYGNKDRLVAQIAKFVSENGAFDFIVHCAGITKALHKHDFYRINFENTKNFVDALIETEAVPKSFIFMSTLGAMGVGDERFYTPMRGNSIPNPNTEYGKSKLLAENYLKSKTNFPYVILRPTGVYGPRDKDYLILMKAVKRGINVGAGNKKQLLTFIHSEDLAEIVFRCIEKEIYRKEYLVADGDAYTDNEFNKMIQNTLKKQHVLTIKVPLSIVKPISIVSEKVAGLFGKTSTLNSDKFLIMKQRNWTCEVSPLQEDLSFTPQYSLRKGIENTVAWYKTKGWL